MNGKHENASIWLVTLNFVRYEYTTSDRDPAFSPDMEGSQHAKL